MHSLPTLLPTWKYHVFHLKVHGLPRQGLWRNSMLLLPIKLFFLYLYGWCLGKYFLCPMYDIFFPCCNLIEVVSSPHIGQALYPFTLKPHRLPYAGNRWWSIIRQPAVWNILPYMHRNNELHPSTSFVDHQLKVLSTYWYRTPVALDLILTLSASNVFFSYTAMVEGCIL